MLSSQPLERPNSHADPTVFTVLVLRNMALSRVRREILERANFDIEDTWKENGSGKKDVRHLTSQDVVFLCVSQVTRKVRERGQGRPQNGVQKYRKNIGFGASLLDGAKPWPHWILATERSGFYGLRVGAMFSRRKLVPPKPT